MGQKIIFLADDDRDDTEMFCEALEEIDDNIVCHCAINGEEFFRKLEMLHEKPQLIFLDLNMPIMDGWECLKKLKDDKNYKNIPAIIISTSSHQEDMVNAVKLGAICYFVKPNSYNELIRVLQVITENVGSGLIDVVKKLQSLESTYIYTEYK